MASVSLENVAKSYGARKALQDITLKIEDGEFFALLGPSGCGKTTLLRLIAGFLSPDAGRILIADKDMQQVPPHKRDVAFVFQNYALWPHMSVAQNVMFGLEMHGLAKAEREAIAEKALAMVEMQGFWDRRPNQLSGGEQQRVALARALALRPAAMLLDEPLSSLDTKLRAQLRQVIMRLHEETKLTMIYVTHDQREALAMADRIAVLNGGRLCQVGTADELCRRPLSPFVAEFLCLEPLQNQ